MRLKITAVKKVWHKDLSDKYENPVSHACDVEEGDVFISDNGLIPPHFCKSAWQNLEPFVKFLAQGNQNLFDGWMKNPKSAMISCNDGFRPVSFYIEVIE